VITLIKTGFQLSSFHCCCNCSSFLWIYISLYLWETQWVINNEKIDRMTFIYTSLYCHFANKIDHNRSLPVRHRYVCNLRMRVLIIYESIQEKVFTLPPHLRAPPTVFYPQLSFRLSAALLWPSLCRSDVFLRVSKTVMINK